MEIFWGLAALLSVGICCIIIAEILCRRLELDRQQPTASEREAEEADAQETYEALSKEIERTACDLAKQCERRR